MDERDVKDVASFAASYAKDICVALIAKGDPVSPETWGEWYGAMGPRMVETVKKAIVSAPPSMPAPSKPVAGQSSLGAPSCPSHGPMVAVEQKEGSRRPLWKCSQAKYEKFKGEVGCPYVIWPPDEAVA